MSGEQSLTTIPVPRGMAVHSEAMADMEEMFAMAARRRELLQEYIKTRLTKKHFYKVPGSDKPSLNKDGAEVICQPHGLKPRYDILSGPQEPAEGDQPYQITVKCRLFNAQGDQGEGLGSASSHITKRDGLRVPRQKDIGLRHNATLKMAKKSAYVDATLSATSASEFFTQDFEDLEDMAQRGGTRAAGPAPEPEEDVDDALAERDAAQRTKAPAQPQAAAPAAAKGQEPDWMRP